MTTLARTLLLLGFLAMPALAQASSCVNDRYGNPVCPPAGGACLFDRYGEPICSGPDGSVQVDRHGEVVCGRGACVTDINGVLMCSTEPRGAVTLDRYAKAVCSGGCEPASKSLCVVPRR